MRLVEKSKDPVLSRIPTTLLIILLVALSLRIPGIFIGLPIADSHAQVYHPDEPKIIRGALAFPEDIVQRTDLRYPTGLHYLVGVLSAPLKALGSESLEVWVYLLGRLVSVAHGVGAVLLLYQLSKDLFDELTGLISAGFLALSLYHVRNASWATTDVATSFWLLLTLLLAYRLQKKGETRGYLGLGIAVGALVGMKYSGVIVLIALGVLFLPKLIERTDRLSVIGGSILSGATALGVFLLSTPSVLVDPGRLVESLQLELNRLIGPQLSRLDPSLWLGVAEKMTAAAGLPIAFLAVFGLIYAFSRSERKRALPLSLLVITYLVYFGNALLPRYLIMVLPILCLFAARPIVTFSQLPRLRAITTMILVLTLGFSLIYTLMGIALILDDTRSEAAIYIETSVPEGSTVGYGDIGNFPRWVWGFPKVNPERYHLVDSLNQPDYVVLTSSRFQQVLEALGSEKLSPDYIWDPEFAFEWTWELPPSPEVFYFYDDLLNEKGRLYQYSLVATFDRSNPVPVEFRPPEIRLYRRVDLSTP